MHTAADTHTISSQELVKERYLPKSKTVIVNGSGVNMERFRKTQIPEKPVFLMVSRIIKEKGVLLELFAAFLCQHNDSKLLIIGDGELKEELEILAKQLKIDKNVIFTGTRSDVGCILSALDAYVCTSTNEGFGLVLLEAFVNGLKVVINKETIVDEIEKLHNCYIVDGFDNIQKWIMKVENAIKNRSENSDENLFNRS